MEKGVHRTKGEVHRSSFQVEPWDRVQKGLGSADGRAE